MVTMNFLTLDVTFPLELQVSEPLPLGELVYNVLLAYSADVSWMVALSSTLFAVTWTFYEWIQHHALRKHHDQAMTKFQLNLLHGLRAYANLMEWFSLASFCDSKPVSHVCHYLNHDNRKSNQILVSTVQKMMFRLFTAVKVNWCIKTACQDSMNLFRGKICSSICLEIWV